MKKHCKFLSFIAVLTVVFVLTNGYSMLYVNAVSIEYDNKISAELKQIIEQSEVDEQIPISVWLNLTQTDSIEAELQKTYKMKSDDYIDEANFEKNIVAPLKAAEATQISTNLLSYRKDSTNADYIRELYSIDNVMTNSEISRCLDEGMTLLEVAKIGKQQEYIKNWRSCVSDIQSAKNNAFIQALSNAGVEYNELEMYDNSSLITMRVSKEDIYKVAQINDVAEINYYVNAEFYDMLSIGNGSNQQKMNIISAQNTFFNNNYGSGIKIGIMEVLDETTNDPIGLNPNYAHVSNSIGTRIIRLTNPSINSSAYTAGNYDYHGAYVTAVASGDAVTVDGTIYRGVAPNATVYFIQFVNETNFREAMQILINNNVNIINCSAGDNTYSGYSDISKYIDEQIRLNKISICIAAGNYSNSSPNYEISSSVAYAYNAIVVGNADLTCQNIPTYGVAVGSKYQQTYYTYATNKPDIVAAGTNIVLAKHSATGTASGIDNNFYDDNHNSGTSLAAPFVAGTIALMMQKDNTLVSNPMAVKAILSVTANPECLANVELISDDTLLYDRAGAGLMDAYAAVSMATGDNDDMGFCTITNVNMSNLDYQYRTASSVYLYPGDTIRVAATFFKSDNNTIPVATSSYGTDVDIVLKNSSDLYVATATSSKDNVEIFEYTATTAGYYSIQYIVLDIASTPFTFKCSVAWMVD